MEKVSFRQISWSFTLGTKSNQTLNNKKKVFIIFSQILNGVPLKHGG